MRKIAFVSALLIALVILGAAATSSAQVSISVSFGPPALPVYEQPVCPGYGYIWTPGYWAWDPDDEDYYWVPGTWVPAPEPGYLWTPPWWGWREGVYVFHEGYWGPHVGFYGGVAYGYGYSGEGFEGGRWEGDRFYYNRSVTNVNVTNVTNVYNQTVINNNVTVNRVSYNGGPGGVQAQPRREDEIAARDRHMMPVAVQTRHIAEARGDRELRASHNQGRPPVAATARPAEFHGRDAVPAREAGAPYHPPANRGGGARPEGGFRPAEGNARSAVHPNDLPKPRPFTPPSTSDPRRNQKYQRQQDKLFARQEQDRQKLQHKQDQEHQRMERRSAPEPQRQQMEQRHQQQTQQLQQRHEQQRQQLEQRQQPKRQ